MSNARTIRYALVAASIFAALSAGGAHAATAVFKDVLKPQGHARSKAERMADGVACGTSAKGALKVIMPVFEKCMRGKGWVLDHYKPDPSSRLHGVTQVNFIDTRGDANAHPRGNDALQANLRTCKAGGRDMESRAFKQCMAGHGWQFAFTQRAPQPRRVAPSNTGWAEQWGESSPGSASNLDDEARRNDQSRADTQAAMDAINASNAAVAAQQAADQQQQINIINQFAPQQP